MPQKFSFVQIPHNKECWEVDWVYLHGTNYCNVHEKTLMSRLPRISWKMTWWYRIENFHAIQVESAEKKSSQPHNNLDFERNYLAKK